MYYIICIKNIYLDKSIDKIVSKKKVINNYIKYFEFLSKKKFNATKQGL